MSEFKDYNVDNVSSQVGGRWDKWLPIGRNRQTRIENQRRRVMENLDRLVRLEEAAEEEFNRRMAEIEEAERLTTRASLRKQKNHTKGRKSKSKRKSKVREKDISCKINRRINIIIQ